MSQLADHELLSLHELLMGTTLSAKKLESHMPKIQDQQLKQLAQACMQHKESFVQKVAGVLSR